MFRLPCLLLIVAVAPSAITADYCDFVRAKDCFHIADMVKVCGTNGVTYRNTCTYAQAYCGDNAIHKAHDGECVKLSTPSPVHGSEVAFDIFCLDLSYIDCPPTGTRVCATDGNYYTNMCEFDKARCYHRQLQATGTSCV